MSPRAVSKAKAPKTVVIDEPSALTTDLTSVLPIDREELAVLVDALGLPRPSRVSPLPDILRSAERTASRSWSEIRAPLETMSDATFADHLTPLIAPDRVVDIRATAYEAAPVPVRLYSSRRHEPGWAGLRSGAERDFEVLAPYIDGDISYFVLLNLKLSMGSSDELPWAALNGAELAFFCAVVDAWRMQFHLTSARRRSRPQPVTFRFDDILEAQRDGWETRDRRWLLTALGETLGVLAHPGGRSGVTFPVLTLDELRQHTRDWVERGWLEVIATGENPTLQLGPPITGAVMSFLAWTTIVVVHSAEVVGVTKGVPAAHEEVLMFIVTGPVIWAVVTNGLTNATDDVRDVSFAIECVTAEQGVETVARFLTPSDAKLPASVYAPYDVAATVATPAPTPAPPAAPPFAPTHVVPAGGLPAWTAPNPQLEIAATLDEYLEVQLLEARPDGWAHIGCSNGWSAWVDGRRLVAS